MLAPHPGLSEDQSAGPVARLCGTTREPGAVHVDGPGLVREV
ncbi:hypothetical protein MA6G0728R_0131 [Mycobacteroides abscessus 6G-0728-R]|uniref:Uncharacterized protein n=1 Tax=Mycobacteroides abscessus 1948 TaxID=1299323 RepID=A0A829QLI4_9MYCO|nr:hypothetical protein MA6G0125R_4403 [Mycobacteroides abscessus 6G-0125-R]EIU51312.1 hypothetical protein MA6G0125S_0133 [Mycobacteroides abscessus 6G-0125-S]EIU56729.1 hypothetical protein MA6G0728S_1758 [Mycobacteroides abscessus 6G-0728-S]EIU73085.1 hypothetical protein MA6G1108_0131 [Mycobacteroides abscessus 6G-1108]EIV01091.1 hypothetical protein MA6G0212_0197 [Mycobacteroides abscessus 6G-0212]EIV02140.1 hypothetical protein MA6G0728R_0131 [Mycobacteroides abscessus 6G-0728-R]ETZ6378